MNYRHVVFIFLFGILFVCKTASASIIINEIAWMGTATSTNDEWIEIFNNGTSAVILDGWTLKATDGSPSINVTGSISAGGYMLLERTDDSTIPTITASVIYSGAMSNTGEDFTLKNNTEQIIDSVNMSSGWTAGNATTKETMQRKGAEWVTGSPTPGAINVTVGTNSDDDNSPPSNPEIEDTLSDNEQKIYIKPDSAYSAQIVLPEIIVQENAITIDSVVKKDGKGLVSLGGRFEWSMGDGGSFIFDRSTSFNYTYHHPGNYIVILRYYSDSFNEKPDTIHRQTISVIPASASVLIDRVSGTVTITNTSTDELNIGNWKLESNDQSFLFPKDTIITKKGSIIVPFQVHKLINWTTSLKLFTSTGYNTSNKEDARQTYSNVPVIQTTDSTEVVEELFKSAESDQKNILNKKDNTGNSLWIFLFIGILIIANILFVLLGKRDNEPEVVVNRV